MTKKFTNEKGVSLLMSVFLADDRYDYDPRPNVISVTTLMKSTRQIILGSRLEEGESLTDISGLLASRLGTAIHESIEKAWVNNHKKALEALGQPQGLINRININPESADEQGINLWFELRSEAVRGKWVISGSSDVIMDGTVKDVKSTKVWTYTSGVKVEDYKLQLSMYRWLNQDKVTKDIGVVEFLFMDHSPLTATYTEGYPPLPVHEQSIPLMSIPETESYVTSKLNAIEHNFEVAEAELPLCTDKELWIRDSEWKYYAKSAAEAKKATKNFKKDKAAAYFHLNEKGKGEVVEVKSKAMACNFCNARNTCSQYTALKAEGKI